MMGAQRFPAVAAVSVDGADHHPEVASWRWSTQGNDPSGYGRRYTVESGTTAEAIVLASLRSVSERAPKEAARVLVIDDDPAVLQALPETLRLRMSAVLVDTANSASTALDRIVTCEYDAIITDIKMPGMDGLTLLAQIRIQRPDTPTLIITGHGEHALAVDALRGGAFDFIQKPIDREYLVASLRRAINASELARRAKHHNGALEHRTRQLERTVEERTRELREVRSVLESPLRWLIGPNQQISEVVQQIINVAESPLTVLIQGETGTGKELAARAIHQLSAHRSRRFVAVDCGAIPETLIESELFGYEKGAFSGAHQRKEGRFRIAESGTLFLDEIGNLPLLTQSKLLRVLQERQVQPLGSPRTIPIEARIVAASNAALDREVSAGRFRQDLYYRLNDFVIVLPPLRSRDDILHLAREFLTEASIEFARPCREISEAAAKALQRHSWPGNVRELRNTIRRAVLLAAEVIEPEHLSSQGAVMSSTARVPEWEAMGERSLREIAEAAAEQAERQAIRDAMESTKGNKREAARLLRTDYKTLHVKMRKYAISAAQFRE